jgi:hypothetical protein
LRIVHAVVIWKTHSTLLLICQGVGRDWTLHDGEQGPEHESRVEDPLLRMIVILRGER